ncbi:hypothetical protein PVAP13_4KG275700 [Panicum virgatum]|uniref:Uncharacterized protein n=1 Tax=Panicum virgatum TaxID=38727 RepID=A0A8T0TK75_PANVG|nr:hypothetical protein PVAP13_4KG275700 [Panicum virgatum]
MVQVTRSSPTAFVRSVCSFFAKGGRKVVPAEGFASELSAWSATADLSSGSLVSSSTAADCISGRQLVAGRCRRVLVRLDSEDDGRWSNTRLFVCGSSSVSRLCLVVHLYCGRTTFPSSFCPGVTLASARLCLEIGRRLKMKEQEGDAAGCVSVYHVF